MNRNGIPCLFKVAIVLLPLAFSNPLPAPAQTAAQQQTQSSPKPKDSEDLDLINTDRPGIADDSLVIGAKKLQVESGFQEEFRRRGETRDHTLFIPTLLRIGISDHWEARIEGNTFSTTSEVDLADISHRFSGLAPFSFGLKYQIQDSHGVKHPSLGTIFRIFPAWGTNDFRTHKVTGDLRLAADWDCAPKLRLSLNPNAGVGIYEDEQGKTFAAGLLAVTLNYLPSKKLNPFIDFGLQAPEEKRGESSVVLDTGVAYILGRNIQFDASVGRGVNGKTPPHTFISFGVSFRSNISRSQEQGHSATTQARAAGDSRYAAIFAKRLGL